MKKNVECRRARLWALAGALLGAAVFLALYGTRVLNPTEVDWLLNGHGDPTQHYLGWVQYRHSEWHLPYLGMSYSTIYPHRVSVLYTDSLPLFAVFFKLLSPLLPETFQYFGWWGLLCFMLQGSLGQCLIARLGAARTHWAHAAALAGAGLLVLFPALRIRMFGHTALAGTWLILAALFVWAFYDRLCPTTLRACLWWALLGLLGAGFHLYYLPMMGIVAVGCAVAALLHRRGAARAFLPILSYCAAALAELFVLGAFAGNYAGTSNGILDGADLLNLFVPGFEDGLETNIYIGAGAVLVCVLAAVTGLAALIRHPEKQAALRRLAPWWVSALVMGLLSAVAATSNTVTLAGHTLFTLPLPQVLFDFWSMFSSCARLSWLLGILLIAAAAAALLRILPTRIALVLLALCMGVQAATQGGALASLAADYRSDTSYEHSDDFSDPGWQVIADSGLIQHLAFASFDIESDTFWGCAELAAENHWTLNCFYLAHMDSSTAAISILGQLDAPQPGTLYVFSSTGDELRRSLYTLNYYRLDGVLVGSLDPLPLPAAEADDSTVAVDLHGLAFGENTASTYDEDGGITLAGGESVSGPQWTLVPGRYVCTIRGEGLDHCYVRSGYHMEKAPYQELDVVFLEGNAQVVSFQFDLGQNAPGWEFAVHTLDERPVRLSEVTLAKIS